MSPHKGSNICNQKSGSPQPPLPTHYSILQLRRITLAARLISLSNRILQTLLYLALLQISATVHMVFLPGLGHINNRRPIGRTHRQRRIKRHNEYQRKDYSTKLPCSIHLNHLHVIVRYIIGSSCYINVNMNYGTIPIHPLRGQAARLHSLSLARARKDCNRLRRWNSHLIH